MFNELLKLETLSLDNRSGCRSLDNCPTAVSCDFCLSSTCFFFSFAFTATCIPSTHRRLLTQFQTRRGSEELTLFLAFVMMARLNFISSLITAMLPLEAAMCAQVIPFCGGSRTCSQSFQIGEEGQKTSRS